jgi:hypothetical protein
VERWTASRSIHTVSAGPSAEKKIIHHIDAPHDTDKQGSQFNHGLEIKFKFTSNNIFFAGLVLNTRNNNCLGTKSRATKWIGTWSGKGCSRASIASCGSSGDGGQQLRSKSTRAAISAAKNLHLPGPNQFNSDKIDGFNRNTQGVINA